MAGASSRDTLCRCVCGRGWALGLGGLPGAQKSWAYSAFIGEALWMTEGGSWGGAEAHGGLQEVTRPKLTGPASGPLEGAQRGEGSR